MIKKFVSGLALLAGVCQFAGLAMAADSAAELDLTIRYYSKVVTSEGVLRESRYEEKMLRRQGHIWVTRVLPAQTNVAAAASPLKKVSAQKNAKAEPEHQHFNPVLLARHVVLDKQKLRLEYIDAAQKQVVAIPPADYQNVYFDGSWDNAFYLIDPKLINSIPVSSRKSEQANARWHERENNQVFQRILWDEKRQLALVVESGDKAGSFFNRFEAIPQAGLQSDLPWQKLKGYGNKEYSDYLD